MNKSKKPSSCRGKAASSDNSVWRGQSKLHKQGLENRGVSIENLGILSRSSVAGIGAARPVTLRQLLAQDLSLGEILARVQKGKDTKGCYLGTRMTRATEPLSPVAGVRGFRVLHSSPYVATPFLRVLVGTFHCFPLP